MQSSSFELRFRIGSIPIVVEPWFWLMGLAMGSSLSGSRLPLWLLVMFVSILVHEMGHALAARAFGARARVKLYSFGGLTYPDRRLSRWRDIAMTLAGPFAGFALGAVAFGVLQAHLALPALAVWMLMQMVYVNVAWGLMNLLPVPPLDGGLVSLGLFGPRNERTARILGVVVAGVVALFGLQSGQLYLGLMFGLLAWQNIQVIRSL